MYFKLLSNFLRFLWVALQIESICTEETDEDIQKALKDLPRDLFSTFCRILQKSGTTGVRYRRSILELLVAALRPLTKEELREALGVVVGDPEWNPARFINNIEDTLACCGSLIIVDEEELTVRFAHHSIKQFLVGTMAHPYSTSGGQSFAASDYQFEHGHAERLMGHVIVTYLNYGIFETQLSRVVVPKLPAKEAPSKIMNSVLDQSKSLNGVKELAIGLLRSRKQTSLDIGKVLSDAKDRFQQESARDSHFLSYAKAYWLHHSTNFFSESERIFSLWKKVVDKNISVRTQISYTK